MPRILVADDNSNIQRMVSLAFKDAGIEVLAVGNGEAAVRKMPEALPDLVLADVFMPVRNGYEVCEFVKHDPRFAHVPVVLLVGAFDPLDEREAQRVQADGVLKKPFVPPDPLVNMVKTLLAKSASERLVTVPVAAAVQAEPQHPAPVAQAERFVDPLPDIDDEPPMEFAAPSLQPKANEQGPVAFSSLLETPVTETDDADTTVTATRDPSLGEPSFWAPAAAPEAKAEPDESPTEHRWGTEADALPRREEAALLRPLEFNPEHEEQVAELRVEVASMQRPEIETAVLEASSPVPETAELPAVAEELHPQQASWAEEAMSSAAPSPEDPEPFEPTTDMAPPATHELQAEERPKAPIPFPLQAPSQVALVEQPVNMESEEESGRGVTFLGYEEDARQFESPLHAEADLKITPEPAPEPGLKLDPVIPQTTAEAAPVATPLLLAAAEIAPKAETISIDSALRSSIDSEIGPAVAAESSASVAATQVLSNESIDAVVERVIERMQPKIMEIVTREILRPVVEALVEREITRR